MKQVSITEGAVTEAMVLIDALEELNFKNKNCLRLLTEEMYSMIRELLKADRLDYEIRADDKTYTLRVSARARVDEEARKLFLSLSTDGKNAANKGIKGMLGAVIEAFIDDGDAVPYEAPWSYGLCVNAQSYSRMWMLSQYMNAAPRERVNRDWDGMEKSIIANFSDDVIIAVRSGRIEMTVTKTFA